MKTRGLPGRFGALALLSLLKVKADACVRFKCSQSHPPVGAEKACKTRTQTCRQGTYIDARAADEQTSPFGEVCRFAAAFDIPTGLGKCTAASANCFCSLFLRLRALSALCAGAHASASSKDSFNAIIFGGLRRSYKKPASHAAVNQKLAASKRQKSAGHAKGFAKKPRKKFRIALSRLRAAGK